MAPTREQMKQWQREVAPGDGVKGWFDRGAWAAAGQREPGVFKWMPAVRFAVLTIALMSAMVALGVTDVPALVGLTIAVVLMVVRANQLHKRYLERHARSPG